MNRKLNITELNRLDGQSYKQKNKLPVVIVLDNIRSLHNVGSAFRTADCFRIMEVCLVGITGRPPNKEIRKTALGASENVAWNYFETVQGCLEYLNQNQMIKCCFEQCSSSVSLNNFAPESGNKFALIFGNEISGVSELLIENADCSLEIPQFGVKHSLNVSVAIGIGLYSFYEKLLSQGFTYE